MRKISVSNTAVVLPPAPDEELIPEILRVVNAKTAMGAGGSTTPFAMEGMMTTAHEAAMELRKLADALDKEPEAVIQQPWVTFMCSTKETFLTIARSIPRPFKKTLRDEGSKWAQLELVYGDFQGPIHTRVCVPQSLTCTLVKPAQPAVYDCDPILSAEEDAELEAAV